MKDYSVDDYRRMLVNVLDVNYGTSWHHIGDGDGLPPGQAEEIAEFWRDYVDEVTKEYFGRTATGATTNG